MSRPKPATSTDRPRSEAGSVSIELVILLPALFAVLFLGMQAALLHHAQTVAIAAAQEGARAAAVQHGREADGHSAARDFIHDAGGDGVLTDPRLNVTRTTTTVTVVVRGHSLSVIPGWSPAVRKQASLPVERVTAP